MRITLVLFFFALAAAADSVVLESGLRIDGAVRERDGKVFVTLDGKERVFDRSRVRAIYRGRTVREEFRARAAQLAAHDAAGWYRLALWAKEKSAGQAPRAFERVLEIDPGHLAARRELGFERVDGEWVSREEAMASKGFVLAGGRWLLPEEADKLMRQGLMEPAKVTKEHRKRAREIAAALCDDDPEVRTAAKSLLDEVPAGALVRPMRRVLYAPDESTRLLAVRMLGRQGDRVALPWLIQGSMYDASPRVRAAARRAVKGFKDADVFYPYARALFSRYAAVSIQAANALAHLGDPRGVDVVLRKVHIGINASSRVNIFVGTQSSYIQDFDVEIAQAAAIGDPIVATIRDGVILDFKILGGYGYGWIVEQRAAYAGALASLTGKDFGEDFKAYARYAKEQDLPKADLSVRKS